MNKIIDVCPVCGSDRYRLYTETRKMCYKCGYFEPAKETENKYIQEMNKKMTLQK